MPLWLEFFGMIAVAAISSTGLWTYVAKRQERKSANHKVLTALAHDRIVEKCNMYLNQRYITPDEFENLRDYLYASYVEMGGNGTAKRLMEEVEKLPIRDHHNGVTK